MYKLNKSTKVIGEFNYMSWTDELKEDVIKRYQEAEPTPENSIEVVTEIAEDIDKTPQGVRLILSRAGVYVSKSPTSSKESTKSTSTTKRVSKADAIQSLSSAISDAGQEVDEEIINKLTGKAAQYFAGVIRQIISD